MPDPYLSPRQRTSRQSPLDLRASQPAAALSSAAHPGHGRRHADCARGQERALTFSLAVVRRLDIWSLTRQTALGEVSSRKRRFSFLLASPLVRGGLSEA